MTDEKLAALMAAVREYGRVKQAYGQAWSSDALALKQRQLNEIQPAYDAVHAAALDWGEALLEDAECTCRVLRRGVA